MAITAQATRLAEPSITTPELQQEVEQFLYAEARMQDERRFHDWLDILAEDIRYFMPVRSTMVSAQTSISLGPRGCQPRKV